MSSDDEAAVGTIAYAAPEQICGEEVGPAADLWSLGVVLYEALAGRLPFLGTSAPAMINAILSGLRRRNGSGRPSHPRDLRADPRT